MEIRTDKIPENLDTLNLRSSRAITSQLEKGEQILLSCEMNKHNKRGDIQRRTLLITNRYVYNIDFKSIKAWLFSFLFSSLAIKRKIAITRIEAITLSTYYLSDQFVLHVPQEYDYRFSGIGKKRGDIIICICKQYREATDKLMTFYLKDSPDLADFQTTDSDAAAGITKMPKDNPIMLSDDDFEHKGFDFVFKNKRLSAMASRSFKEVKPEQNILPSNVTKSDELQKGIYNPSANFDQISEAESVFFKKSA